MDKRWIYIIIILILGLTCLFFIVESSTTIGKASSKIGGYIVTIPDSMNIQTSEAKSLDLINRKTNERMHIEINKDKGNFTDENFTSELEKLNIREDVNNIQNTSIKIGNDTLPTLCYDKVGNDTFNQISVLYKFNHTFIIKSSDFKDNNTITKNVKFMVNSLKVDYKQKQD